MVAGMEDGKRCSKLYTHGNNPVEMEVLFMQERENS